MFDLNFVSVATIVIHEVTKLKVVHLLKLQYLQGIDWPTNWTPNIVFPRFLIHSAVFQDFDFVFQSNYATSRTNYVGSYFVQKLSYAHFGVHLEAFAKSVNDLISPNLTSCPHY